MPEKQMEGGTRNIKNRQETDRFYHTELETAAVFGSSADLQQVPGLLAKHTQDESLKINTDIPATMNVGGLINVLNVLINRFHDVNGLIAQLSQVNQSIKKGLLRSTRRFELEALQAGQVGNAPFIHLAYSLLHTSPPPPFFFSLSPRGEGQKQRRLRFCA